MARCGLSETMPSGSLGLGRRPPPMSPNQSCYQRLQVGCMHDSMLQKMTLRCLRSRQWPGTNFQDVVGSGICMEVLYGSSGLSAQCRSAHRPALQKLAEAKLPVVMRHLGPLVWCGSGIGKIMLREVTRPAVELFICHCPAATWLDRRLQMPGVSEDSQLWLRRTQHWPRPGLCNSWPIIRAGHLAAHEIWACCQMRTSGSVKGG